MHQQILDNLEKALAEGDENALEQSVGETAEYCFKDLPADPAKRFPEDLFAFILKALDNPGFLRMPGSFKLLMWIEYDWARFARHQKDLLLAALARAYPKFADWMACFVVSEILGEYFADERALSILLQLSRVREETARALVPHGFEELAKHTTNPLLAAGALVELQLMTKDPSQTVRDEAFISLKRFETWQYKRNNEGPMRKQDQ